MGIDKFIDKVRKRETPLYAFFYNLYKDTHNISLSIPKPIAGFLYSERLLRHNLWLCLKNKFYYEPLLKARCTYIGRNVKCDGDIPLIVGGGKVIIGDNVLIGNKEAWFVAPNIYEEPVLRIGDNTTINCGTYISVESMVTIGNNCIIAEQTKIFDNNSHGIDYRHRKMTKKDISPVIIEDDVWIGMNSIILKGVTLGRGSVVAAGSVVTKNVPPMNLVAGNPARIIKKIKTADSIECEN